MEPKTINPMHPAPWSILFLIALFATAGLLLSFAQIKAYTGNGGPIGNSEWLCGSQDALEYGCSGVFASRYGKFFGVPLPHFGSLYFLSVIIWLAIFRRDSLNMFFLILLGIGGVISLSLLFILFFVLPGICNWCLLIHFSNGAMIFSALAGYIKKRQFFDFSYFGYRVTKAFLVLFILLALAGGVAWTSFYRQTNILKKAYLAIRLDPTYQSCLYYSEKKHEIPLLPDDHILGSRSAPVIIVVYKDAQCEFCHQAWDAILEIYNKYNAGDKKQVAIVLRQYPLSDRCNPHMNSNLHPYACPSARALEAAAITGGEEAFWRYHGLLHKNFRNLDESPYLRLASGMKLDRTSFLAALKDPRVSEKLKKDADSLHALVEKPAVPIIFINGRYVDGWQVKGFIDKIVQEQLEGGESKENDDEKNE
jgi:uncharacterized membrane protein/protein-disulfide isomerase